MTRNPGDESVEVLHKRAVARFNSLTYAIIGEISSMLSKAKLLPIPELQLNNPTFEEVVSQLRLYRALSEKVAELLKIDRKDELAELDAYIAYWNTRRRQEKLEGHTPEEFQSMSLAV